MILSELKIHHLRNISTAHLGLSSRFNFIFGANGSGKTSILEALYLLSCGHSFRSREISPIIAYEAPSLTVFARGQNQETISIQKSYSDPTQIKLNNQFCSTTSQLAYALPCLVFYSDIFQIIDAGPSVRRSLLDWGLFHVKHTYLSLLKEYKKVLKQRNALLRQHAPYPHFIPWDKQLSQLAQQLHVLREEYFAQWEISFTSVLQKLSQLDCKILYYKGWDKKNTGKELEQVLVESFVADMQKGYTQQGAHQADILIQVNQNKARHILSRGQQKIILIALRLAQARLLANDCLFLIDDLPAELDEAHQLKLMTYLAQTKGQYVITSTVYPSSLVANVSHQDHLLFNLHEGLVNQQ
ncbi:DNA replication/repair protein RecF [Fluoribacter dumoffii]|uniref:DNA replication and repair protein RecF n=1 Tax=Fluoribacter dumoffii TaxID=463 RepID=A0A377G6J0_9GAMM|nr:DNA replication/repair protein RecF [Fluoribacter dumoffii]KTC91493.1 RecF recombinational DNA repair ATPase [Fluoribacter dumoffii NY 23]MCW8387383.1 DNA replication/repair protein RecF [Fluoribacter dumoffii]MCW8417110.1 DNA replication/repair protein RecF [Fluoribacter dumoffii]MCW8455050.1 DNA replication/repair protein RecF [Fluoribacter dumoffii]MCW8460873.1 DNA replication/repair protein RecF [Fluoribacter dumoffii]